MDPLIAFALFAVLLVLESLAAQRWSRPYFRLGIPIFFTRTALDQSLDAGQAAQALNRRFTSSPHHPSIRFKSIGPNQIALREVLFENRGGIRYLPVMHSLVRLHQQQGLITLTGYLNWSILAALVYIFYRSMAERSFIPVGLLIIFILSLSYLFQAAVTGRIGQELQKMAASQNQRRTA